MRHRLQRTALLAAMLLTLALSDRAAEAVRQGLELCARSVIPSLFPFLVLTGLFTSVCGDLGGNRLGFLMARLYHCSPQGIGAFFLGILGGYPMGARVIDRLYADGKISRQEGENLLCLCNNAGPAFILSLVGAGKFGSLFLGVILYLIHVAAALLAGMVMVRRNIMVFDAVPSGTKQHSFPQAFVQAVTSAGGAMVNICAYVISAVTFLQLFVRLTGLSHPLLLGAVELTNGITLLGGQKKDFILASALLGWGGLSVHGQAAAVMPQLHPPMGRYLLSKLLHSVLSALLSCVAAQFIF